MRHHVTKWSLAVATLGVVSCGQDSERKFGQAPTGYVPSESTLEEKYFLEDLSLLSKTGAFEVRSDLTAVTNSGKRCYLKKHRVYPVSAIGNIENGSRIVTMGERADTCRGETLSLKEESHTLYLSATYEAVPDYNTVLKATTAQSSTLSPAQKCSVPRDSRLTLASPAVKEGVHAKITLATPHPGCSLESGYIYIPHFSFISFDVREMEDSFGDVMKHILLWEGGCSDHPNDPGGRTFMGITTSRARQNGWTADVCTMPESMVLNIYRKDYWSTRPVHFKWPLNLAVMNTEVNSGGGRARQFITRMEDQNIDGTTQQVASWFVDQQTAFYRLIAERNSKLRVFLRGWLNRSNYMQDVIWERRSLALTEMDSYELGLGSAKAQD